MTGHIPALRIPAFLLAHDTHTGDVVVGSAHKHGTSWAAGTRRVIVGEACAIPCKGVEVRGTNLASKASDVTVSEI